MCSWQNLRVCLGTEILWSLLSELIMVIDISYWNGLSCLYELRDTKWEDMVDKLKF